MIRCARARASPEGCFIGLCPPVMNPIKGFFETSCMTSSSSSFLSSSSSLASCMIRCARARAAPEGGFKDFRPAVMNPVVFISSPDEVELKTSSFSPPPSSSSCPSCLPPPFSGKSNKDVSSLSTSSGLMLASTSAIKLRILPKDAVDGAFMGLLLAVINPPVNAIVGRPPACSSSSPSSRSGEECCACGGVLLLGVVRW